MLKKEVMLVTNTKRELYLYRVRKKRYKNSIKLGTEKKKTFCIRYYQICRDTDWERERERNK